ncbi:MAG: hypothetical protein J7M26_06465 [Armatimonadetes bacterium]|nr:hypothetical protein [Armatimonadota bacterium]
MAEHEEDQQPEQESEVPAGEEAESAKPSRRSSPGAVVAAVVLVLAAVGAAYWSWHTYMRPKPLTSSQTCPTFPDDSLTEGTPETIPSESGDQEAKVKVEACLGHCISGLMKGFIACAKAWPEKIYVRYYAYESPEGQKFVTDHGHDLACIVINGQDHFTLEDEHGKYDVDLVGPPGMNYSAQDLVKILQQVMKEAYGELPEDFDKVTAVFSDNLGSPESRGP